MLKHFAWDIAGKSGSLAITLISSFVLTRYLEPAEFGPAAVAIVIAYILSIFQELGLYRALVQRDVLGNHEYNSAFTVHLMAGILLGVCCFFSAKPIADFYELPLLEFFLKVISAGFVFNSIALVPTARLTREMHFKALSVSGIGSALLASVISIVIVLKGYGAWSLVVQYLLTLLFNAIFLTVYVNWKPGFDYKSVYFLPLWKYARPMYYSTLLSNLVAKLDVIIVGKIFPTAVLGHYSRAQSIDSASRSLTGGSFHSVFFSLVSKHQAKRNQLLELYKRYLHLAAFFSAALTGLLYIVSPDLFVLMFTAKWTEAAYYFQVMSIASFTWPIGSLMVTIIAGVGNSKAYFKLEGLKTGLQLLFYVFAFWQGLNFFLWTLVVMRLLFLMSNAWFVSRELAIKPGHQMLIILPYVLNAIFAAWISVLLINYSGVENNLPRAMLLLVVYSTIFLFIQYFLKTAAIRDLLVVWKNRVSRKQIQPGT